jgi:hypothetical protein
VPAVNRAVPGRRAQVASPDEAASGLVAH